jgi:hypothetical protein
MARQTRNSQAAAAAEGSRVAAPHAKKAPVAKHAPHAKKAPVAKSTAKAKGEARKRGIEKAKEEAKKKLFEKTKAEAIAKAKEEERKKAMAQAQQAARAGAQVTAANNKPVESKDKKEANLLYLRAALATAFSNQFKGSAWSIPQKDAITNLHNKEFTVSRKIGNTEHRCKMAMDQDTASFQLTPVSTTSLDGLNRSFAAYLESYNKWRVQQNLQGNKEYDLTFTLNVENKEDLKVILKGLHKECNVTKFQRKGVDLTAREVEVIQNEIAAENPASRPKAKVK